jgi:phage-related protein
MREAGYQLNKVQHGDEPTDWKPLPSVGIGTAEIRIHNIREYRIIYTAKFSDAIYVLRVFQKTTQKTPVQEIRMARKAYAQIEKL